MMTVEIKEACPNCIVYIQLLERFFPWLQSVNHVHLLDGTILYASEVWDILYSKNSNLR